MKKFINNGTSELSRCCSRCSRKLFFNYSVLNFASLPDQSVMSVSRGTWITFLERESIHLPKFRPKHTYQHTLGENMHGNGFESSETLINNHILYFRLNQSDCHFRINYKTVGTLPCDLWNEKEKNEKYNSHVYREKCCLQSILRQSVQQPQQSHRQLHTEAIDVLGSHQFNRKK